MRKKQLLVWGSQALFFLFMAFQIASCKPDKPEAPQLSADNTSFQVQPTGGELTLNITSNITWTLVATGTPSPDWITLSKAEGNGNAAVKLTVAANPAMTARTATLKLSANGVSDVTITVTQALAPAALAVDKTALNYETAAAEQTIALTSNTSWTATVSAGADWLTLDKTTGTSNATVKMSTTANTGLNARTATVTFKATGVNDVVVTVAQKGVLAWEKTLGGNSEDYLTSMLAVSNGFVVLGQKYNGTNYDIYLIKLSFDGQTVKETTISKAGVTPLSITATSDGGFVVLGQSTNNNNSRIYAVKLDANLNETGKEQTIDKGYTMFASSVVATPDGGVVILGTDINNGYYKTYVAKLNSNLNIIEKETLIDKGSETRGRAITATSDGGFIIVSSIYNGNNTDIHITRLDANLNATGKENTIDKGGSEDAYSIISTADNKFILSGKTDTKIYLAQLDGNLVKVKENSIDENPTRITAIAATSDGGFAITASIGYGSAENIYAARLDANLALIQGKEIVIDKGNGDQGRAIIATADGGFILGGSVNTANNHSDLYIARITK